MRLWSLSEHHQLRTELSRCSICCEKIFQQRCFKNLTLSESAVIAGITQSPGNLNPITNPQKNQKRRDKVLKNMLKQGYIDQAAYDEAMADDVYARIQSVNETQTDSSNAYSYFVDALADQVMDDLQDQCGFSETQAYNAVYSGGLSIYSTQNQSLQQICDEEANDDSNYPSNIEYVSTMH